MAYVFYDTETSGIQTAFDQVLQFAAIKTDADFNIIESINIRSRLQPHIIPSPYALCVTGMPIGKLLDPKTPSHYSMVRQIREKLLDWSPAIFVGYNSLKFDEVLLRQALYQTLHPPYLTNTGGNCRADVMALVQSAAEFAPDAIAIPIGSNGKRSFKLDRLAPANGFSHENAHDALADVEATIHLCRIIRNRAPALWNRFIQFSNKAGVSGFMREQRAFLLTQFRYNVPYHYVVTHVGFDRDQPNSAICFNLACDLDELRRLSDEQLQTRIAKSPQPLRPIKINDAPFLSGLADVSVEVLRGATTTELLERAEAFHQDGDLKTRLLAASNESRTEYDRSPHVEERLYDGFASRSDERLMQAFHTCDWADRVAIVESLDDQRLKFLGRRLIHFERPELLPPPHRAELDAHIASRMMEGGKWTTLAKALEDTEKLLETAIGEEAEMLHDYRSHLLARGRVA